jgi:hypothetical protein
MELERYTTIEESDVAFINSYYEVKLASLQKQIAERAERIKANTERIREIDLQLKALYYEIS